MKKGFSIFLCLLLLLIMLVGCGKTETGQISPSAKETQNAAVSPKASELSIETEKKNFFDVSLDIPVDAIIEEGDDRVKYSMYDDGNEGASLVIVMSIGQYSDVKSTQDLENGVAENLWKSTKEDAGTVSNEEKAKRSIDGIDVYYYDIDYLMDGEEDVHSKNAVFFLNNRTYMLFLISQNDYQDKYGAYVDGLLDTMSFDVQEETILSDQDRRWEINSLNDTLKYDELLELVNAYIAEKSPMETDPAFKIKEATESILKVLPECKIVTDDFSGDTVIYGGVDAISSKINFVPRISQEDYLGGYVYADVGFQQKGWLFFDSVEIKIDEDNYCSEYFDYDETVRDVISGSTIKEEGEMSLSLEDAEALLQLESPVMRFENLDEGKKRDHTITKEELAALNRIYQIEKYRDIIETTIEEWEEVYG